MNPPTPRRRGRPRRDSEAPTLAPLAFRPAPDTRALLERAAAEAGHSLSAEVDRRLRQAYWTRDQYRDERERYFGGAHNYVLAFLLARVATGVEHKCGASWQHDPAVWREVGTALFAMIQMMGGAKSGSAHLPMTPAGRPNRAWRQLQFVEGKNAIPAWWHVVSLVDLVLSKDVQLFWPLVDTLKTEPSEVRDDVMPNSEELRRLYKRSGTTAVFDQE